MKYQIKNLLCIAVLLLPLATGAAVNTSESPSISVFGTAKTEVQPDEMIWHLSVSNKGIALRDVSHEHSRLIKRVLAIISGANVEKGKVQTSNMSFGENYVYRDRSRVKEGFVASTSITFTLTDFGKYESLWYALSEVEEASVNNVNYSLSNIVEVRNKTRVKAVEAAKTKAKALANAAGSSLGITLSIEETEADHQPLQELNRVAVMADAPMGGTNAIAPGLISVSAKIRLELELINN